MHNYYYYKQFALTRHSTRDTKPRLVEKKTHFLVLTYFDENTLGAMYLTTRDGVMNGSSDVQTAGCCDSSYLKLHLQTLGHDKKHYISEFKNYNNIPSALMSQHLTLLTLEWSCGLHNYM